VPTNLKNTEPKISVLVLTFNQSQFIERTLRSVVDQHSDQYDLEIIITDDGSSDGTVKIIRDFVGSPLVPITILAKNHEGVTAIAKNLLSMINLSTGDFICFLAGDDYFSENRFSAQLEKFACRPSLKISYADGINCIDGIFGQRCHSVDTAKLMESGDANQVYRHLVSATPVLFIQGVLAKSDFLKIIQPFDVDLIADDWVFNIKVFQSLIADGGDFDFEPNVCFIRNIHAENTSRNLLVHYERVRQVAERYCSNADLITSKFVGNALISSIKKKDKATFIFFFGKSIFLPISIYWFLRTLIASAVRKIFRF